MLKNLFSSLIGFKSYLIAAAFMAVLAFAGVQTFRLSLTQADNKILTAQKEGLEALISAQNAGVKAVADKSKALEAAAARAEVAVNKIASVAEARARAVLSAPVPKDCPSAIDFLVRDAAMTGVP